MRKIITLLLFSFSLVSQSQISTLYIGSYTDGDSEGIYTYQFNSETGSLKNRQLVAKAKSPSYLITSSKKDYVFAVSERDNYKNTKSGAVASYKVKKDGTLEQVSEISSSGENPCHLSLNEKEDKLAISNYSGGSFSIVEINENRELARIAQIVNLNQETKKSHAHSAQFYKNELFVADLGINTLEHFTFKDTLYLPTKSIEMDSISGPRHFSMTKNQAFIYVLNELGSTISTLKKVNNSYVKTNTISTLNEDFKGKNACADIHFSKDEKYLYASNRGDNSIVVFERNKKDGTLKKIQRIDCGGNWPRNFTLGPEGNFLLVANKKSSNIAIFLVDKDTGELTFVYDVKTPNPSCLKF